MATHGDYEITLRGNLFESEFDRNFFVEVIELAHKRGFKHFVRSVEVTPTPRWADAAKQPEKKGKQ